MTITSLKAQIETLKRHNQEIEKKYESIFYFIYNEYRDVA